MMRLHIFQPVAVPNSNGNFYIGYGHTRTTKKDQRITEVEARRLLQEDMAIYARFVEKIVKVPLSDNQFSSLTAFCAHISAYVFERTDLVRLLNRGWYDQVPAQLKKWGEKQNGIYKVQRAAESQLWKTPDPPTPQEGDETTVAA